MVVEWERLALPVLVALADGTDRRVREGYIGLGRGRGAAALALDIDDGELHDALLALQDAQYVHIDTIEYASGGASVIGARVTGRGMQALGQWPSLQAATTPITLAAILDLLQDYALDDATHTSLGEASDAVKKLGVGAVREALTAFGAEALKARLGLR